MPRRTAPDRRAVLSLVLGCLAGTACAPLEPGFGVADEAIVGGSLESGYPAVMYMYRTDGSACTGTLITPRYVLTARHCVVDRAMRVTAPASIFRLQVGTESRSPVRTYTVESVHIPPGSSADLSTATDVALLRLSTDASETPMPISRTSPTALIGTTATAMGFGRTPSGSSGVKLRVSVNIARVDTSGSNPGIYSGVSVCPGDSGSGLIGPDGAIWGVASYIYSTDGRSPVCGSAPGVYNEIHRHLAWIDDVTGGPPACVPAPEVCNGRDDDCNGVVDEGCVALGEPCSAGQQCAGGGSCANTPAGMRCALGCDGSRPRMGCSAGFYCASAPGTCAGFCVPGSPGDAPLGAPCGSDTACDSGMCRGGVCAQPCRADAADCGATEVCDAPAAGTCGSCREPGASLRGLGEPCASATECRSGLCSAEGECAEPCSSSETCGAGYYCLDGLCLVDRRQGIGGPCATPGDCTTDLCALQGGRSFCTGLCDDGATCPSGFSCEDTGAGASVCVPSARTAGEACEAPSDCLTELCAAFPGQAGFCTHLCDGELRCGADFACERTAAGEQICVPRVAARDRRAPRGCSATRGEQPRDGLPFSSLLAGLALTARARRRRA